MSASAAAVALPDDAQGLSATFEIDELARIRNKVVHQADGFKFTFKEHLDVKKEFNLFREGFKGVWPPLPDGSPDRDAAEKDPSLTITMAALLVTDNVLASATEAKANQGKAVSRP
jgi:hypothetical protein